MENVKANYSPILNRENVIDGDLIVTFHYLIEISYYKTVFGAFYYEFKWKMQWFKHLKQQKIQIRNKSFLV